MAIWEDGKPSIGVAGIGGAGCNTINRLLRMGVGDARPIAINTDKKHLALVHKGAAKLLIGKSLTKGLGAGGFPEVAQKAALASRKEIKNALEGIDLLFIAAGMGGGTGTGAAPVVAQIAKDQGAIVVAMVTFPFAIEKARINKAREGLDRLLEFADTTVVIDNNRLTDYVPNVQIEKAFEVADDITAKAMRGISKTILEPSLINIDFADMKSVLGKGGVSMIAVGEAHGVGRAQDVVENTLKNRLLEADVGGSEGVLLHIEGGSDLTIGDVNEVGELMTQNVSKNANVIFGARAEPGKESSIEVISIFTGITLPLFIRG